VGVLLYGASTTVAVLFHAYGRAHGIHPETHASMSTGGGLTLPFIILNSVTNPLFEELLEAGYLISALHKLGMWPAILAGALIRAFLHAYLGASGAMAVLATGVIFGLVYWRWRQLWPLIVAHALLDFLGLMHVDIIRFFHLT
jgi:membrane protease YdiL (CAAX protease family)